ncbi:MAG: DUF5069 domain-containing protein [Vulcanimicrobiaceae bacterium]
MDLTKQFPRSPREQLGGMSILPRAIDKARAQLAGKLGDYVYFECSISRMLFNTLGVTDDEFLEAVRQSQTDQDVLQWVEEYVRPERYKIEEMNQKLETAEPNPEQRDYFQKELQAADPGNTMVKTWADLIDLQEGRLPKQQAVR